MLIGGGDDALGRGLVPEATGDGERAWLGGGAAGTRGTVGAASTLAMGLKKPAKSNLAAGVLEVLAAVSPDLSFA